MKTRCEVSDVGKSCYAEIFAAYSLSALSLTTNFGSSQDQKIRKGDLKMDPTIYNLKIIDWDYRTEIRCDVSDVGKLAVLEFLCSAWFISIISHLRGWSSQDRKNGKVDLKTYSVIYDLNMFDWDYRLKQGEEFQTSGSWLDFYQNVTFMYSTPVSSNMVFILILTIVQIICIGLVLNWSYDTFVLNLRWIQAN